MAAQSTNCEGGFLKLVFARTSLAGMITAEGYADAPTQRPHASAHGVEAGRIPVRENTEATACGSRTEEKRAFTELRLQNFFAPHRLMMRRSLHRQLLPARNQ